jgi:short-subunit dehydrogenase
MTSDHSSRPTAFITGASSGIGAAYARQLAAQGYDLTLCARNRTRLAELSKEIADRFGVSAAVLALDLSDQKGLDLAVAHVEADTGPDVLVHSAGFGTRGHLVEVGLDNVQRMAFLHVVAGTVLARAALPAMVERNRGALIMVSSLAAYFTTAHYVIYSATKAYLNRFVIGLWDELAGSEVQAQVLCPGLVRTGFMHTAEYGDFDYGEVPNWAWMSPEAVVRESLGKLGTKAVVVPGLFNRLFVAVMGAPIIGGLLRGAMGYASRRRVRDGKPALF